MTAAASTMSAGTAGSVDPPPPGAGPAPVGRSEALSLGAKAGLDPALMCEVITAGTGRNSSADSKFPRAVLTGTFDVGATNTIAAKDMALAMAEFAALGVPAPLTGLARELWAVTKASQGPEADMTTVARMYEQWTGVPLRAHAKKRGSGGG